jgi:hypothetical protein
MRLTAYVKFLSSPATSQRWAIATTASSSWRRSWSSCQWQDVVPSLQQRRCGDYQPLILCTMSPVCHAAVGQTRLFRGRCCVAPGACTRWIASRRARPHGCNGLKTDISPATQSANTDRRADRSTAVLFLGSFRLETGRLGQQSHRSMSQASISVTRSCEWL